MLRAGHLFPSAGPQTNCLWMPTFYKVNLLQSSPKKVGPPLLSAAIMSSHCSVRSRCYRLKQLLFPGFMRAMSKRPNTFLLPRDLEIQIRRKVSATEHDRHLRSSHAQARYRHRHRSRHSTRLRSRLRRRCILW